MSDFGQLDFLHPPGVPVQVLSNFLRVLRALCGEFISGFVTGALRAALSGFYVFGGFADGRVNRFVPARPVYSVMLPFDKDLRRRWAAADFTVLRCAFWHTFCRSGFCREGAELVPTSVGSPFRFSAGPEGPALRHYLTTQFFVGKALKGLPSPGTVSLETTSG